MILMNKEFAEANPGITRIFQQLCENGCVPEGVPAGHKDGWGIIGLSETGPSQKYHDLRPPMSAESEDMLADFAKNNPTTLAHLRKASHGSVRIENCHPFAGYEFAFAHNGSIESVEEIIAECMDGMPVRLMHAGDTDSERLFALCIHMAKKACGDSTSDPDAFANAFRNALVEVASKICDRFAKTPGTDKAFNVLASNGKRHFAMRLFNAGHPKADEMNFEKYYTLHANVADGRLALCSEPIGSASGWEAIPNGELWEFEGCSISAKTKIG